MSTVTNQNSSQTTVGSQGGVNIGGAGKDKLESYLENAFTQGGVAELTPELQAALAAMQGGTSNAGANALAQAGNILGGNMTTSADQIKDMAGNLVDKEYLGNQLNQLSQASQESLQGALTNIDQGASMAGGLGSSRAALAQGQAIGDSQEALINAQSQLVGNTYQNAMNQAMNINQSNVSNQLAQAGALGNLGIGQGQLGMAQQQQQIDNLLAAGKITQAQADAMKNQGMNKLGALMPILQSIYGSTNQSTTNTNTNSNKNESTDWDKITAGIVSSAAGSLVDSYLGGGKK